MRGSRLIVCAVLVAAMAVPAEAEDISCGGIAPLDVYCQRTTTARTSSPLPVVNVGPEFLGSGFAEVSSATAIRQTLCYYDLFIAFCDFYSSGVFSVGQALTFKGQVGGYRVPAVGSWTARLID